MPYLIITYSVSLQIWQEEIEKWIPDAFVTIFAGNKLSLDVAKSQELHFGAPIKKNITKFNILVTTYDILNSGRIL